MTRGTSADRPEGLAAKVAAALDRLGRARRISRQAVATAHGLTPLQLDLLATLADGSPPPPHVGALAAEVGVAQPTATDAVNALARKGLVGRRPDPTDARRSLLTLTRSGSRAVDELRRVDAEIAGAVDALAPAVQAATLEALLTILAGLVDTGAVTVARTCLTCRHHRRSGDAHHCTLLERDLPTGDLRVNCPDHEPVLGAGRS